MAMMRSCHLLEKYADAEIEGGLVSYDKSNKDDKKIDIIIEKINKVLGIEIPKEEVVSILESLGFGGRYSFVTGDVPSELHPSILKDNIYVFEINLTKFLSNYPSRMTYKDIPKFPSISKDIAFILDKNITAGDVMATIKKAGGKLLQSISVFDVYTGENVASDKKSIAFNLNFMDINRTLTDEEVMTVFNEIAEKVCNTYKAEVRDK